MLNFTHTRLYNYIECILLTQPRSLRSVSGWDFKFICVKPSHEKRAFGISDTNMALKSQDKDNLL